MPLPVLPQHALTSDRDLLRQFQRTERLWAEHLGELEQLDAGVAVTNADLPKVHDANRLLEAALSPGQSPVQAHGEVSKHFADRGVACWNWQLSTSTDSKDAGRADLDEHLRTLGYRRTTEDVMALSSFAGGTSIQPSEDTRTPEPPPVTILPTRAALRQAWELSRESDTPDAEPTLADAQMLHLDDPHCDSLIAMRDGKAVGRVTVFAVGDIGRIEQFYLSSSARRQGLGRLMISRALEICARSLFRHVLLSVDPANVPAITLYQRFGFRKIGEVVIYRSP